MSGPVVLIHGNWHWGGCWRKVSDRLAARGIPAAAPDLASHGFDPTPWDAIPDMETYTAPVRRLIEGIDGKVTLVGHSMGGVSLTYLAARMPERISALVYLCAFMTAPGRRAGDHIRDNAADPVAAPLFEVVEPVDGGRGMQVMPDRAEALRAAFYGDCSAADIAHCGANLARINTTVPDGWAPEAQTELPRHYVYCTEDRAIPLACQERMNAEAPGARPWRIAASHSPFLSQPDRVADILSGIVGEAA